MLGAGSRGGSPTDAAGLPPQTLPARAASHRLRAALALLKHPSPAPSTLSLLQLVSS